jgi:hypothetical protein
VYPYFSETPLLPAEGARLGLWVLKEAHPDFRIEDFRVVDVLRRSYFRPIEIPLQGNEQKCSFNMMPSLREWRKLRDEP